MRNRFLGVMALLLAVVALHAQGLPQDSEFRKGVLSNGLTYYIRHNGKTPHQADLYIAQRVGSILEEPQQRGLAHFLEHMAFNGTEHFPGDGIRPDLRSWCESVGIKFGRNLNAYTSVDRTVYNISSAPIAREGVLDSCLLILHDWSHSLLLTDEEIDKERGVIQEEWRSRRSGMAMERMMETAAAGMYVGTKYADCLPIGSMDVVNHFQYKELRDYYTKWYRPDLQAIIVVGDVDVERVEQKIQKLFGKIMMPENAPRLIQYPVPDNKEMIVAMAKDPEQPTMNINFYIKRNALSRDEKNTIGFLKDNYYDAVITTMLSSRMQELMLRPNSPVVSASVRNGAFFIANTKNALSGSFVSKEGKVKEGFLAMLGVLEQARQNGFTPSEYARAKSVYKNRITKNYKTRKTRENSSFVSLSLRNFLDGEPLLSAESRYDYEKTIADEMSLADVNDKVRQVIRHDNQVVVVYAPDKPDVKIPTAEELKEWTKQAVEQVYPPYEDAVDATDLIEDLPAFGDIVSEKTGKHGVTEFVLSNGVKVFVKPTDFTADNISLNMFSKGGASLYPDADVANLTYLKRAVTEAGIGKYNAIQLKKALAGRSVRIAPFVDEYTEGIKGSSSIKDFKTMMELMYLYFTSPRKDTVAYNNLMARTRTMLANRNVSPKVVYNDSTNLILYGNKERVHPVKLEDLHKLNYDRMLEIYKERFADASDFNLILIGTINLDSLRPILKQYVATLPSLHRKETFRDTHTDIRPVDEVHHFTRKLETPSTLVNIYYTAKVPFTTKNDLALDVLSQVMRQAYTEKVREEKGGTYGVSVRGSLEKYPYSEALLKISFRTAPSKYDELIPIIYDEIKLMAKKGPSEQNLAKVKEFLLKTYQQNIRTNDYWNYVIYNELYRDIDFDTDYIKQVNKLTVKDIKAIASAFIKQKHRIEITMSSQE